MRFPVDLPDNQEETRSQEDRIGNQMHCEASIRYFQSPLEARGGALRSSGPA